MKATIAGITYEGTYDEITAIVDRMTPKIEGNPYMPIKEGMPADWLVRYPKQANTVTRTTTGTDILYKADSPTAQGLQWDGHWRN